MFPLLAITIFIAFSCEKDLFNPEPPNKLPPITMTGEHTFGCLVNREVWRPYIEGASIWDDPALNAKHDRGWVDCDQLFIGATRHLYGDDSLHQTIIINVWCPVLGENNMTPLKGVFLDFHASSICGYKYRVDTLSPYIVNITKLDTVNFIASGTFEFTAVNNECPEDTLRITEGRFDVDSRL